jgi:hypothetical protein
MVGRMRGIEQLEEFDEFAAMLVIVDQRVGAGTGLD